MLGRDPADLLDGEAVGDDRRAVDALGLAASATVARSSFTRWCSASVSSATTFE